MTAPSRRPDLLSRSEAAAYLGRSRSWLAHNPPELGGPSCIRGGREVLYRKADLDYYLDHTALVESAACPSTATPTPAPIGTDSRSPASRTGSRPTRGIAAKQRKRSAEREQRSKGPQFEVLKGGS